MKLMKNNAYYTFVSPENLNQISECGIIQAMKSGRLHSFLILEYNDFSRLPG